MEMRKQQFTLGGTAGEFAEYWKNSGRKVHGGDYAIGKRKTARPFAAKKAMHVVMRSEKARGKWSFRRPQVYGHVVKLIQRYAARCNVKVYKLSVNSNHLHVLVHSKSRLQLQRFLRCLGGKLAQLITGALKGNRVGKFWDGLAFTRIAEWGKDFRGAKDYVRQNQREAAGTIAYKSRGGKSQKLLSPALMEVASAPIFASEIGRKRKSARIGPARCAGMGSVELDRTVRDQGRGAHTQTQTLKQKKRQVSLAFQIPAHPYAGYNF